MKSHHQELLGSKTQIRNGVAAFDFATVSGCDQLVVGPTHARGGTFDLHDRLIFLTDHGLLF